jgi:ATP-binding cassette subfamily B protein
MNWLLTVTCALPVSLMTFVWIRLGPVWDKWWRDWRETMSETNNLLEALYSGSKLVKAYVLEDRSAARFRAVLDRRITAALKGAGMQALFNTLFSSIGDLGALLVLGAGGVMVIRGRLTLGEFVAFNAYVQMLLWPMMGIGDMFVWIRQTGVEEQRVRELAEHEEGRRGEGGGRKAEDEGQRAEARRQEPRGKSQDGGGGRRKAEGGIEFERVTFAYPAEGERRPALDCVSIAVPNGGTVGIAGTVGSGKSTIARLLLRLADPDSGAIRFQGRPLGEYEKGVLRGRIGYAPQEPGLFSVTVRENIVLGRPFDAGRLAAVVRVAQLDADLAEMPKGLDEVIGEGGLKLSGGQRGRVAIARALYGSPEVLVLDDVTSSLDAETEQAFVRAVLAEMRDTTVIVISHRLAMLSACDVVYVLDEGRVVESGRHDELLERRGLYWKLYHKQIAGGPASA